MSTPSHVPGREWTLVLVVVLAVCAALLMTGLLTASMPRALLLIALALAISAGGASLVLAIASARRSRARARTFQELLAQAAHQLRTPNATLTMELDAALADPALTGQGRDLAQRLSVQVEAQNSLIRRLLAYARLDLRTDPVEVADAATLLEEASRVLHPLAATEGARVEVDARAATVRGSRAELRELLVILGENAILHGHGTACLVIREEPRSTIIEVFDEGPGITAAPGTATEGRSGNGLGLELARRIAARHYGSLHIEQRPMSRAAQVPVVSVRLPHRKTLARHPS